MRIVFMYLGSGQRGAYLSLVHSYSYMIRVIALSGSVFGSAYARKLPYVEYPEFWSLGFCGVGMDKWRADWHIAASWPQGFGPGHCGSKARSASGNEKGFPLNYSGAEVLCGPFGTAQLPFCLSQLLLLAQMWQVFRRCLDEQRCYTGRTEI